MMQNKGLCLSYSFLSTNQITHSRFVCSLSKMVEAEGSFEESRVFRNSAVFCNDCSF